MRRSRRTHRIALLLLVPALTASAPSVQLCSLNWDQLSAATLIRCLMPGVPGVACATATTSARAPARADATDPRAPLCAEPARAITCCAAACARHLAERATASACSDSTACTLPCAAAARIAPATSTPAPRSSTPHSRAYCLGDPLGGRALPSSAPPIVTPETFVAVLPMAATLTPDPAPAQTAWPELRPLFPSRPVAARPPLRAPPEAG